jgi:HAE1 family hydrophobic/amphiphilic exporter-1
MTAHRNEGQATDRGEVRQAEGGGLSAVAIRRPVFTTMLMLGLVVLGLFAYRGLPIDQFPDVSIPVVTVQTTYPGASAQTVEREVTRRLEEAFNPVQGVKKLTSISLESVSQVIVEFDLGRDADAASQDLRAKIELIRRDLPTDIDPPVVQKLDPAAQPIISLAVRSKTVPLSTLTTIAEEPLRRRLEAVDGVGEVRVSGGVRRQVNVFLQPARLQALGVTVPEVMGALQRQNLEVPAGRLERGTGEQLVRVTGRITEAASFGDVIVATRGGDPVRLRDVARVEDGAEEKRSLALVNGEAAVALDLLKVSGANTVAVADGVAAALDDARALLPAGATLQVVRDNSVMIRQSVDDVIHELLLGAVLTVLIVMLFLNDFKATAITALALPVSVISAFVLMGALGFTLNVLTLLALSISIGILIDDAIVVVENIVRRRELGDDVFTAAREGTREILLAVLATTLSIVAVFVPVAFMKGIIGRFFFEFGLTVAWAVLVSLFVSFTLTPMLSAWWGVQPHTGEGGNVVTRGIGRFNRWFDAQALRYRNLLRWALGHRRSMIGLAVASFVGALALFPLIGGSFSPESDDGQFIVKFETPQGASLSYTQAKAEQLDAVLRALPEVDYVYATVGAGATGTVTNGEAFVQLVPVGQRTRSQTEMMAVARTAMAGVAGVQSQVLLEGGIGGAVAPLQVELRGPDLDTLARLSAEALAAVRAVPSVVDARTTLGAPRPEVRVELNRDVANRVGLDVGALAATIRPLLAGEVATRWEDPTGEERDVLVQLAPESRLSRADLAQLPVPTGRLGAAGTATVPLGDVAQLDNGNAPAEIRRQNMQRTVIIEGAPAPGVSVSEASTALNTALAGLTLPEGYRFQLGGETEQLAETGGYVVEAILLAVVLIFLILASQFESFTQPVAIMLSLPLSLIGVLVALLLTGDTLNIMSMIGVIMLFGLVTKNAILLVDNANERRRSGASRLEALVEAGAVRLRPIMMTTAAMIFGMLPIALALGQGGGFRAPMARAVIGGLITSTALTLLVVPVAYTYFDDLGAWVSAKFRRSDRRSAAEPVPVAGD